MTGDFPLFGQAIRRTFTASGRARRTEVILYVFVSQIVVAALVGLTGLAAGPEAKAWVRLAANAVAILPLFTLTVRRLHDFGQSGKWSVLLVLVAARAFGLDLATRLGGWDVRALIERPLSYVDWLLFLPFAWLYIALLIVPGRKGANRHGPDPREDDAPAAGSGQNGKRDGDDLANGLGADAHAHVG